MIGLLGLSSGTQIPMAEDKSDKMWSGIMPESRCKIVSAVGGAGTGSRNDKVSLYRISNWNRQNPMLTQNSASIVLHLKNKVQNGGQS